MQTPSTAQIRTAIEVLRKFGEHLNHKTTNAVIQLSDSQFHDRQTGRVEVQGIEQITRVKSVATQLEAWRNELVQKQAHCVSHHV